MLAWMGGRRRLVKEQKARRKLQGVFDKVATKVKPAGVTAARQPRSAREADAVAERLSRMPLSSEGIGPISLDVAAILGPMAPLRLVARPLHEQGEQGQQGQGSPAAADEESWHTPKASAPVSKTNLQKCNTTSAAAASAAASHPTDPTSMEL
jgi:hypothetical protein